MPTGYTADLVNGTMNTVEEYAKLCMRAFGATLHMRDEPLDKQYKPSEPSTYHLDAMNDAKKDIERLQSTPIEEIKAGILERAEKSLKDAIERKINKMELKVKLESMLVEIEKLQLDNRYKEFKNFMRSQITQTIDWDCNLKYCENDIQSAKETLNNVDAEKYIQDELIRLNEMIAYHTDKYKADVKQCDEANEWVSDLLNILKKKH